MNAEAKAQIQALREELQGVQKERGGLADNLEARQKAYRLELEDRERALATAQEAFEQQSASLRLQSAKQSEAQLARISLTA